MNSKTVSVICFAIYLLVSTFLLYFLDQRGDQPVGLIVVEIIFAPVILMILSGLPLDIGSSLRLRRKND